MIIKNLSNLKKINKIALVDGCFDPIHEGHIEYFKIARQKARGFKIVCCNANDKYIKKKHPVFLKETSRIKVLDSIRYIDYVVLNDLSTKAILDKIRPNIYFKGIEWKGKLPLKEIEICKKNDTRIVFINAKFNSSTKIIKNYVKKYQKFR